jgi:hypothetical protein
MQLVLEIPVLVHEDFMVYHEISIKFALTFELVVQNMVLQMNWM